MGQLQCGDVLEFARRDGSKIEFSVDVTSATCMPEFSVDVTCSAQQAYTSQKVLDDIRHSTPRTMSWCWR